MIWQKCTDNPIDYKKNNNFIWNKFYVKNNGDEFNVKHYKICIKTWDSLKLRRVTIRDYIKYLLLKLAKLWHMRQACYFDLSRLD